MPEGMQLLHLRVLSLGLFQDWDFWICALPQFQEISARTWRVCDPRILSMPAPIAGTPVHLSDR